MTNTLRNGIGTPFTIVIGAFLLCTIMTSCSKEKEELIGLWDPMEWKTEVDMDKEGIITVSSSGGTFVFDCTNYKHVWISEVWETTEDGLKEFYNVNAENGDYNNIETSWGKISIDGNIVTIALYPNFSSQTREYKVSVTAGDIFHHFIFKQNWDSWDGLWALMEWETDADMVVKEGQAFISAPASGGAYFFNCTNYTYIVVAWVEHVDSQGKIEYFSNWKANVKEVFHQETSWGKIDVKGTGVTIEVYPNDSSEKRTFVPAVVSGDAFYHFNFEQAGK